MNATGFLLILLLAPPLTSSPIFRGAAPAPAADARRALEEHYERLGSISAVGVRSSVFSKETDLEILASRAQHDEGALVEWHQQSGAHFTLYMDPTGKPVHKTLTRDGWTLQYDYASRHGTRGRAVVGFGLCPSVYFLVVPPQIYLELIPTALVETPTADELGLGATASLSIVHPSMKPRTMLRVAIDAAAPRVLRVDYSYEPAGGSFQLFERYTFDNWTQHNGEPFPLRFTVEVHSSDGSVEEATRLDLAHPESDPVPMDLMVPSGTTYGEPSSGHATELVGGLSGFDLADALSDLYEWTEGRTNARLFLGPGVALPEALTRLHGWKAQREEVPLQTSRANYECGPNALVLAMALVLGASAPYETIEESLAPSTRGVSVAELMNVVQASGLDGKAIRGSIDEVLQYECPALLPVKTRAADRMPNHFVLLAGRMDEVPLFMNPPAASFRPDAAWLADHWMGDALLVSRASPAPHWSGRRTSALLLGSLLAVVLIVVTLKAGRRA